MHRTILTTLIALLCLASMPFAQANALPGALNQDDVIQILSTMDELNARHYQIIHISDGSLHEKSGFQHLHAKKISYFGPQSKSNTAPKLRHAIMLYSPKYGWYIQRTGQDSRGAFVEIYSQKLGSVIVR